MAVRLDGHCPNLGATVNLIRPHGRLGQKGEAALSVGLKGRDSAKGLARMTRAASIDESSECAGHFSFENSGWSVA